MLEGLLKLHITYSGNYPPHLGPAAVEDPDASVSVRRILSKPLTRPHGTSIEFRKSAIPGPIQLLIPVTTSSFQVLSLDYIKVIGARVLYDRTLDDLFVSPLILPITGSQGGEVVGGRGQG